MPVAVIENRAGFGLLVAQVFGQNAERLDQDLAIGYPEAVAIEIGEHPLVWIEAVAVGVIESVVDVAELRAEGSSARHGRVHMEPDSAFAADAADFRDRVKCVG